MHFRAHVLLVDPVPVSSVRYFLMLTQMPDDGRMERRTVVEGVYIGHSDADSLREDFVRAKMSPESVEQLNKALMSDAPLAFVGVLSLDSIQLSELGFLTLAKMVEVLDIRK